MRPTISVIVPVYNGARFIGEALESVFAQTYLPSEILVVDDVSTDNTREVVAEIARNAPVPITMFSMEKNTGGPYGPARRAFHRTAGDFVCVLDADDMFVPEAFETYMAMFAADPQAKVGLATSDILMFDDETGAVLRESYFALFPDLLRRVLDDASPAGVLLERDEAVRMLCTGYVIWFKGMIARAAWETLDGPNLVYLHVCDMDFVWRLVTRTDIRVRLTNRRLIRYRIRRGSMSKDNVGLSREQIKLLREMRYDVRDRSELVSLMRPRLEEQLFELAYYSYKRRKLRTLIPAAWGLGVARLRRQLGFE